MKKWDVLALGNTAIDDLLYVPEFPAPDVKLQVLHSQRQCGGLAATSIVAAARLGARCAYAGALGSDELSTLVETTLAREGVDVSQVVRREDASPTHSRIVVGQETGTRNIFYEVTGFSGADETRPDADVIRATRVLFADRWGVEGILRAMRIAREAGIPIVGDVEKNNFPHFAEWLALVDHLIVPEEFALALTDVDTAEAATRKLWTEARAVVVVTMGKEGCYALSRDSNAPQHFPAFAVETVDTTGCGDVFHGAYAAALAQEHNLVQRIHFASAAAALKATQPGGQSGIPSRVQVEEFLKLCSV